jgi:hypothetical protein
MSSNAPGVQSTSPTFYQAPSVKDAEKAHKAKMENSDGGGSSSGSESQAKISPQQYPGKK